MRVLVTGARGKVGAAAVAAFLDAGHEVTALDLGTPVFEGGLPGAAAYLQADLTDAGDAFAAVRGHEAVVHSAAIPDPVHSPAHRVFQNNLMATFNVIEAAVRFGVPRVVNVSSETVPGFFFPEREFLPDYAPVDEEHPIRPQDPYATAKHFGEQLMDGAVRRSDLTGVSIRPSWVQWEGNYARNLGAALRDPENAPSASLWAYIDAYDLADSLVLAATADTPGHEVVYIASPDNHVNRPWAELVRHHHGDAIELRETEREDASGISIAKARRLLGYDPSRSWRDYLTDDGELRPEAADRLERGETGVQRGRALTG
jgi:nucleoside-diphosphate-sugar epimerase